MPGLQLLPFLSYIGKTNKKGWGGGGKITPYQIRVNKLKKTYSVVVCCNKTLPNILNTWTIDDPFQRTGKQDFFI